MACVWKFLFYSSNGKESPNAEEQIRLTIAYLYTIASLLWDAKARMSSISRAHAPLNPFLFCALGFLPVSSSAVEIRIESPLMDFSGCTVGFGLAVHHLLLVAIGVNSGLNIIEEAPNGGCGKPPCFLVLAIRGPGPHSVTTYRIRLAMGD